MLKIFLNILVNMKIKIRIEKLMLFCFILTTLQIQAQDTEVNYSFTEMYNYNKLTETEKTTIEQEANEFLSQKEATDDEAEIEQLNWEIYRRCHRHLLAQDEVNYIIQQLKIVEQQVGRTSNKATRIFKKNKE